MLLSQPGESRSQSARSSNIIADLLRRVAPISSQPVVEADAASAETVQEAVPTVSPGMAVEAGAARRPEMRFREPFVVFLVTLAVLLFFTQRVVAYLTPTTGDEPFYLMTAISILQDGDLNECNNYAEHDEAQLYPSFYSFDGKRAYAAFPSDWVGWKGAPYPLPPHAGHI